MNSSSRKHGYRSARIERAAAEILECDILPGLTDPQLENLRVFSVQLVGGLSCLHVLVAPGTPDVAKNLEAIGEALSKVEGRVRAELAAVLRIKRMPAVRLRYVPISGMGVPPINCGAGVPPGNCGAGVPPAQDRPEGGAA